MRLPLLQLIILIFLDDGPVAPCLSLFLRFGLDALRELDSARHTELSGS